MRLVGWGFIILFSASTCVYGQSTVTLNKVAFGSANTVFAVGLSGAIVRSDDGGATWLTLSAVTGNTLRGLSFVNASLGWVVGDGGTIFRTTDGGSSWTSQASGTTAKLQSVSFVDANNGTIVGSPVTIGSSSVILHTTNGGATWTSQTSGTTKDLFGVSFADANNGIAVGYAGVIVKTANGGATWSPQSSGVTTNLNAVVYTDANTATAVGTYAVILRTTNGGSTWAKQTSANILGIYGVSFVGSNTGTVVGVSGNIQRTVNGGGTWTAQSTGTSDGFSGVAFFDANHGVAVGPTGYVFQTVNGGSTWTKQLLGTAQPPSTPGSFNLLSPANGATGQAISGTLSWQASSNATSYDVYLDGNNPPTTLVSASQTATSYNYSGLANSATYYWKVVAKNSSGTTAATGSPWSFSTVAPPPPAPGAFNLLSPANGATGQAISGTLSWQASTNATAYDVYLDGNNPPTTVVGANQTATTYTYSGLNNNAAYYWKVVAKNSTGTTAATGSPWSFTTIVAAPAAPVLSSPANLATGVSIAPVLSWSAAAGASSYRLQVSASSGFATTVADLSGVTALSQTVTGLSYSSTYYWRVNATNAGGTSAWSTAWSFGTQIPPPGAFSLLSPVNGATGQATSGTLSWQASSNATSYDVYLDGNNPPTTLVSASQTATSYSYSGLANSASYYWKVVAKNSTGTTTATGSPWNFVTAAPPPPVPGAFNLLSPANGATGQATSGTLTWQASSNATSYDVYLDGNNPPTTIVGANQTATSYNYSGLANSATYYWKVVAKNTSGTTAATGAPWSFSTVAPPPPAPGAFNLLLPTNGATGQAISGTLSWQASTNATAYDVYLGGNNPPTTVVSANQTATTYSYSGLTNNATYYWKVVAKNSSGTTAATGSPWSFTTIVALPSAFNLLSPATGATGQSTSGTLTWQASTNAAAYDVYLDGNPPTTIVSANQTGTSYNYSGLANNTTYYWKVVAKNAAGSTTATASPWSFTTALGGSGGTSPQTPTLLSPANAAASQPLTLTFSWSASTGATTYRVQVSPSSSFTSFIVDDSTLTGTSRQVSGLSYSSTYYWRVNAKNSSGTSGWSTIWSFSTQIPPPGAFNLLAPANGATGQATSGSLSWQGSTNATAYDVYLDGNNPPTTIVSTGQTATSYSYAGLSTSATYYWKVVARNTTGTTAAAGSPWSFVTAAPPPPTPGAFNLLSPSNGATGQTTSGTLTWQASTNATGYDVYLGTANPPTTVVSANQAAASYNYSGLFNNTVYYWKVVAKNSTGTATASGSPWSFTVQGASPSAFALVSPANGSTGQPTSGSLTWQASSNAVTYDVYFGTTNPPTTIVSANQPGTSYAYGSLANNSRYYWNVVAKNSSGSLAATGAPWYFTTLKKGKPRLSAVTINFGIVQPGTPKKDSFMLYNIGDTTLSLQSIAVNNVVFKVTPTSTEVAAADSQRFYIQATTSSLIAETGAVVFNYNDGIDPDTLLALTSSVLGVEQGNRNSPDRVALNPNFPNPFNPATTISYQLTSRSRVTLRVYNLLGQLAATLKDGVEDAGYKSEVWNADHFASGIYFYQLEVVPSSGEVFSQMRKMILAK